MSNSLNLEKQRIVWHVPLGILTPRESQMGIFVEPCDCGTVSINAVERRHLWITNNPEDFFKLMIKTEEAQKYLGIHNKTEKHVITGNPHVFFHDLSFCCRQRLYGNNQCAHIWDVPIFCMIWRHMNLQLNMWCNRADKYYSITLRSQVDWLTVQMFIFAVGFKNHVPSIEPGGIVSGGGLVIYQLILWLLHKLHNLLI